MSNVASQLEDIRMRTLELRAEILTDELDSARKAHERSKCVYLGNFESGWSITVKTLNSIYEIKVLKPKELQIEVRGGEFFKEPEIVVFWGSRHISGGSPISRGFFAFGGHMEFGRYGDKPPVITTKVESFFVYDSKGDRVVIGSLIGKLGTMNF